MLKGRLSALASVVALVVLTGGAAGLSVAKSSSTEQMAIAALRSAVVATQEFQQFHGIDQ